MICFCCCCCCFFFPSESLYLLSRKKKKKKIITERHWCRKRKKKGLLESNFHVLNKFSVSISSPPSHFKIVQRIRLFVVLSNCFCRTDCDVFPNLYTGFDWVIPASASRKWLFCGKIKFCHTQLFGSAL